MSDFLNEYRSRVANKAKNAKEVEKKRAEQAFKSYLDNTPTSQKVQITDVDEPFISKKTKKVLAAITDVTNNDKSVLDEKNLFVERNVNMDVGCYVKFDNQTWLIIFEEHQPLGVKKQYIMKKCNNYITLKYRGNLVQIPVSIENLTMYSDGIADDVYMSYMDSKKQIGYGNNYITRTIGEGFRILLTHETAYKVTHINDFEYKGLIKSLVLQTQILVGDETDIFLANNIGYFNNLSPEKRVEEPKDIKGEILGENKLLLGEESEFIFETKNKEHEFEWILEEDYIFNIIENNGNKVTVVATTNPKYIGKKAVLKIKEKKTEEIIDKIELILRG